MGGVVKRRSGRDFRMLLNQPFLLLVILMVFAILITFVLLPLGNILLLSVTDKQAAGISFARVAELVGSPRYRETFWNSIKLGAVSAVLATALGYAFAFAITRTEMAGKRFFRMIAILPIISPPFVLGLAIIFLFGRQGLITNGLFGMYESDVYGFTSLVTVQVVSFFPIAFITLVGILEAIDDSVEDAAYNLGATRGQIFRTVTLPLSLPGIISALLLVFIQSLEDFGNPAVIGGSYSTLSVEAYRLITGMNDVQGGAILSVFLLLPTLAAFALQKYWISKKSFVTVTGKPTQIRRKLHEPHIVWPLFAFCALASGVVILFYGTVLVGAFVKTWGVNHTITLDHFYYVFSLGWDPIKNSLILALIAAPIAGLLGMAIAFLTVRVKFTGKRFMEFSSILTFALPGTVLGIGYVLTFNSPPLVLTGGAMILVAAFVFRNMPVGIEAAQATLLQIDPSIEEASRMSGAGAGYTFRRITLPLLRQALFSGLVFSFVRSMTAVSSVIFLISPQWNLATARVFSLFEASQYSRAAAYIIVMIAIIMGAIGLIQFLLDVLFKPKYLRKPSRLRPPRPPERPRGGETQ